ncbi:unnamed protein product [Leptidea sinapis]|uniref:Uncharacterized protein n=1 Tax=Leptidea sinapis TaxID=189913 RepID=A0A5E4Q0S1_9NEOP|nr:unnamed protein product [Leptidea sinapis]
MKLVSLFLVLSIATLVSCSYEQTDIDVVSNYQDSPDTRYGDAGNDHKNIFRRSKESHMSKVEKELLKLFEEIVPLIQHVPWKYVQLNKSGSDEKTSLFCGQSYVFISVFTLSHSSHTYKANIHGQYDMTSWVQPIQEPHKVKHEIIDAEELNNRYWQHGRYAWLNIIMGIIFRPKIPIRPPKFPIRPPKIPIRPPKIRPPKIKPPPKKPSATKPPVKPTKKPPKATTKKPKKGDNSNDIDIDVDIRVNSTNNCECVCPPDEVPSGSEEPSSPEELSSLGEPYPSY